MSRLVAPPVYGAVVRLQLLSHATEDGAGEWVLWPGADGEGGSFFGAFDVEGTFDGATVTLQYSPDGGATARDLHADVALTAPGSVNFGRPRQKLRAVVAGAGASADISAWVGA